MKLVVASHDWRAVVAWGSYYAETGRETSYGITPDFLLQLWVQK